MSTTPLLPLPDGLEITSVSHTPEALVVRVTSTRASSPCPLCATPSHSIHSYYRRRPADLPCSGRRIVLLLTVRKFFCRLNSCPRKVFTERLPDLLEASSRLTTRLRSAVQTIGGITTAEAGERLSKGLGMPVSATTILRSLHRLPPPAIERANVVSLDEWAWKRGRRYGTIIVDLEHHRVLDLLAESSKESAQAWLEAHPGITIVGRDRGGTYADAATWGAPLATQVADRWHLCKNIGDAIEGFLVRTRVRIPEAPATLHRESPAHISEASVAPSPPTRREQQAQARAARRQERFEQVHQLHAQGLGVRAIGRALSLDRKTVRKYLNTQGVLHAAPRPKRRSLLEPYADYLLKRWQDGCVNAARLFREIEAQGYCGSATTVRDFVARLRKQSPPTTPTRQHAMAASPRQLRWLLAGDHENLEQEEREDLQRLLSTSAQLRQVHALLHAFLQMVRQRQPERLRPWMEEATGSGIPELKSFVVGIERDYDAVKEALRQPWSQGPTEGFINKLKTLKRMMYGRAGFELLRRRMLLAAS